MRHDVDGLERHPAFQLTGRILQSVRSANQQDHVPIPPQIRGQIGQRTIEQHELGTTGAPLDRLNHASWLIQRWDDGLYGSHFHCAYRLRRADRLCQVRALPTVPDRDTPQCRQSHGRGRKENHPKPQDSQVQRICAHDCPGPKT